MKKIILAPDSFKGTMSASEVSGILKNIASKHFKNFEIIEMPVADGGEGTVDAFVRILNGEVRTITVSGPLGAPVEAKIGLIGDSAIIELAQASGITLIDKLDPYKASTFGTGEMILFTINQGIKKIYVGLGGSATNDGGTGLLRALGVVFRSSDGRELIATDEILLNLDYIDVSGINPKIREVEIECFCDVDVPLLGEKGATSIFGPQKGVLDKAFFENGLRRFAGLISKQFGIDTKNIYGAGAAGGTTTALCAFLGATSTSGIEKLLDLGAFDTLLEDAYFVVSGEGRLDSQSVRGKVVSGIATRCKAKGIPLLVIAGSLSEDYEVVYEYGVTAVMSCVPSPMSFEDVRAKPAQLLEKAADRAFRLIIFKE